MLRFARRRAHVRKDCSAHVMATNHHVTCMHERCRTVHCTVPALARELYLVDATMASHDSDPNFHFQGEAAWRASRM